MRLADVAKAAGVGYGTASRAISGRGSIDDATRERVLHAAEALGYRPDAAARALRERRSRTIGLIIPDIVNEFYTSSAEILQSTLAENGYQLVVATTANDPERDREAIRSMLDRQVDGIVHVPIVTGRSVEVSVPLIELNRTTGRDAVLSDDVDGVARLAKLIAQAGAHDIVAIVGPRSLSTSRDREAGILAGLNPLGYESDGLSGRRVRVVETEYTVDGGHRAMAGLAGDMPDAVIALSSRIALGVLRFVSEQGLTIPDDLRLAAYGDPEWFSIWDPSITTYAPPLAEMGALAAQALLAELSAQTLPSLRPVRGQLRVRRSHLPTAQTD